MGKKQSSSSSFWHPRRRSSSAPATPRADPAPLGLGCMSMVHYLIFAPGAGCVGRPPTSSNAVAAVVASRDTNYHHDKRNAVGQEEEKRGGLEAPRNSLDPDADNLNDIPIGVQIEPVFDALACRKMRSKATAPSSEAETPRTPSLVARLMGIDGLPENTNSSPSPAQHHHKKKPTTATGTARASSAHSSSPTASSSTSASKQKEKKKRVIPESIVSREPLRSLSCNVVSLPESPRGSTSTSARASWDGARLSLQALKDNVMERTAQYMSLPTSPTSSASASSSGKKNNKNKKKDSNKQERITAKEIVRQAKEAVANRNKEKQRQSSPACTRDNKENVMMSPVRKDKSLLPAVQERKHQPSPLPSNAQEKNPRVPLAPRNPPPPPPPQRAKPSRPPPPPPPITETPRAAKKPDGCERFATRIKKPGTPPVSSPSPVTPPAPATRLSSSSPPSSSTSRGHVARSLLEDEDPEYGYLRKVLERGGFLNRNHRTRPFNPSSPVDPIVFHLLELDLPVDESRLGPLRHRWNRKLMFHLAQEILADLLLVSSPAAGGDQLLSLGGAAHKSTTMTGASLLSRVLNRVRSFPAANCRVVGDIDALVAMDLRSPATVRRLDQHPAVVDEATDVAEEVADQVLDTLLQELGLPEGGMTKESPSLSSLALLCNQRNPVT